MRFVCDKTPGGQAVITQAYNPLTGEVVAFSAPVTFLDPNQLDVLLANFDLYCRMCNHFGQAVAESVDPTAWPSTREEMASFRSTLDSF